MSHALVFLGGAVLGAVLTLGLMARKEGPVSEPPLLEPPGDLRLDQLFEIATRWEQAQLGQRATITPPRHHGSAER